MESASHASEQRTNRMDFPLPANLPRPVDDGGANHLVGMEMPQISLTSTAGKEVTLSDPNTARTVVYCYPMTGVPGKPLPEGWDMIPGARGCTPQTCGFRDQRGEFERMKVQVFGLSTQTTDYQREMTNRLGVLFEILSDAEFKLTNTLRLPTFEVDGMRLLKRLTFIVRQGRIEHVFYPVFPPDQSAAEVVRWLKRHPLPEYGLQ
jgi:peroxiredoxin